MGCMGQDRILVQPHLAVTQQRLCSTLRNSHPPHCAQVNIRELGVYGEDHMLVQKAKELYQEVAGRPMPGGGLNGVE